MRALSALILAGAMVLVAADKKPPTATVSNDKLEITAILYPDKETVQQVIGSDLGGYFTVIRVELTPKGGEPLKIYRDDFLLRSYKDGQKSGPYQPSQIAGKGALVVSTNVYGGGTAAENNGPVWGGIPGTGQPPMRLPGNQPPNVGMAAGEEAAEAKVQSGAKEKDNPLLATLKEKVLQEKETKEPMAGLLYFSLEGKHKPKDLVLQYNGQAGKLTLTFK